MTTHLATALRNFSAVDAAASPDTLVVALDETSPPSAPSNG